MEYPHLPGLTPDGRIYYNDSLGTLEALIPPGNFQSAHAPALLETEEGDLLCAWFAGSFEGNSDVQIVCSRLPWGENQWTEPQPVSGDPRRSEQNPSLFAAPDGAVWAVYTAQMDRMEGKDNMQFTSVIRCQKSRDGGRTWGRPELLFDRPGSFCRQPIQILSNGRWIFANWLCEDTADGLAADPTVVQISDDQGRNWRAVEMPGSKGRVHANIVELGEGCLAAFMRSRQADFIYKSSSSDWGDTWSVPVPTEIPNNNSSISAIRLKSGNLALACNPTCAPVPGKDEAVWPGLRCPVAVTISEDGGESWPLMRYMEQGEGYAGAENRTSNCQYEYPFLMQSHDGRLHLAFAYKNRMGIKYMSFSEEQIRGKKRERTGVYNPTSLQGV